MMSQTDLCKKMMSGSGSDLLFAENAGEMETLVETGETAQGIDARGDLISGGIGNDFLYGSNAKDLLFGGTGKDLLRAEKITLRRAA